jgi:hypothetical protein
MRDATRTTQVLRKYFPKSFVRESGRLAVLRVVQHAKRTPGDERGKLRIAHFDGIVFTLMRSTEIKFTACHVE